MLFSMLGLSLGGCLVFTVAKTAGDVTTSVVKTTGSVAVATVQTGGTVAASVVRTGVGVAVSGVQTAASLAKAGAVVVLDSGSGAVWEMPWTRGMPMSMAIGAATKAGVQVISGKLVRKSKELAIPQDRWAKTYLEAGDVVVVDKPKKL
jgi:phosphohistidine swiveling domain-containing protein